MICDLSRVGAWTGLSSLRNQKRDIEVVQSLGLTDIYTFVNDLSSARKRTRFSTYDLVKFYDWHQRLREIGVRSHVTSWVMPHQSFIVEASETLVPMCNSINAFSLMWDAEEPWTLARGLEKHDSYEPASERLDKEFLGLQCDMGFTGIVYTPVRKLRPLADVCDYGCPQGYATWTSKIAPGRAQRKSDERYRQKLGCKQIRMGLAAYRTTPERMATDIEQSSLLGISEVIYWSLGWIRRQKAISQFIQGITSGVQQRQQLGGLK